MPGWLSRAAACASRRTRRPASPALLDRLDRDRALEAAVPGLVDDAEAAAADAALDQEAVEDEGTDQSSFDFGAGARLSCARGLGKRHRLRRLLTRRPRQASYSPASQPAWRAASWRIRQHARPRRRERPKRRPERQQIMLRRGLALGGGLIVLILIVLGVKGCLDARANRELSDYARNVTQIVDETEQTSKDFFGKLADPGDLSVTEFVDRGQRRPQRHGQLRLADRRARRPRRHGPGPERAGAGLRAARQRDGPKSPTR